MSLLEGIGVAATATGHGHVDWSAVARSAKAVTEPGSGDLPAAEAAAYADAVRGARRDVRELTGLSFELPEAVVVQNRHHWIDANCGTFRRLLAPLEDVPVALPELTRRLNTATLAVLLAVLSRKVLGQYDPVLLAEGDRGLYFVRPNIQHATAVLAVEPDAFRRWIVIHEVTHAAQFDAAPWLAPTIESSLETVIASLAEGRLDREALGELEAVMTAVEGYAEFVMDHALDGPADELRARVNARRRHRGTVAELLARVVGLDLKRRQYERGRAFFEAIASTAGLGVTAAVWDDPDALPRPAELDDPAAWRRRVDP